MMADKTVKEIVDTAILDLTISDEDLFGSSKKPYRNKKPDFQVKKSVDGLASLLGEMSARIRSGVALETDETHCAWINSLERMSKYQWEQFSGCVSIAIRDMAFKSKIEDTKERIKSGKITEDELTAAAKALCTFNLDGDFPKKAFFR